MLILLIPTLLCAIMIGRAGGTASPTAGITDAGGEFSSNIIPGATTTALTVIVEAQDSGQTQSRNLEAARSGNGASLVYGSSYFIHSISRIYDGSITKDEVSSGSDLTAAGIHFNYNTSISKTLIEGGHASGTNITSMDIEFDSDEAGSLTAIRGSLDMSSTSSYSGNTESSFGSGNSVGRVHITLAVTGDPVPVTLTVTFRDNQESTPGNVVFLNLLTVSWREGQVVPDTFESSGTLAPGLYEILISNQSCLSFSSGEGSNPSETAGWSFEVLFQ